MRILLVEDDERIAMDVSKALREAGYVVEHAANGEEAWFLGDTENFAAVVLDLGLPGLDGMTVLKRWRDRGCETPVLVLTARGSWSERVEVSTRGISSAPNHGSRSLKRIGTMPKPSFVQEVPSNGGKSTRRLIQPCCNCVPTARKQRRPKKLYKTCSQRLIDPMEARQEKPKLLYRPSFRLQTSSPPSRTCGPTKTCST